MSLILVKRTEECEDQRCRLCLTNGQAVISIFDEEEAVHHLLQFTLNIEVDITEKFYPLNICPSCLKKMKDFAEFKIRCEVSQKQLLLETKKKNKRVYKRRTTSKVSAAKSEDASKTEGDKINAKVKVRRKGICKCSHCKLFFENKEESIAHRRVCVYRNQLVICDVCGQNVKQRYVNQHKLQHSKVLEHACERCEYRTYSKELLKKHSRVHDGVRPYACPFCEQTFVYSSNLTKHRRRHYQKQFQCEYCERLFVDSWEVKRHISEVHCNAQRVHQCTMCDKTYANRKQQRKHERRFHNAPLLRAGKLPTYITLQREMQIDSSDERERDRYNMPQNAHDMR